MRILSLIAFLFCAFLSAGSAAAQTMPIGTVEAVEKIPAMAVLAAHKLKIDSELNAMQVRYTDTHVLLIGKKHELDVTRREMAKILIMPESQKPLLTDCYGKLVVSKIKAESALLELLSVYTLDAPKVRRATDELQAVENELSHLLK